MKILPAALQIGEATKPAFLNVFESIKESFPESEWGKDKFSSSEADASKIATRLYEIVEKDLQELLKKQRKIDVVASED